MAEKIKDAEDRILESMFASQPIADDGFSAAIVKKVHRQKWLRRLTLPLAAIIGGAIAYKPLIGLFTVVTELSILLPTDALNSASASIPQIQMLVMGGILLGAGLLGVRLIEE